MDDQTKLRLIALGADVLKLNPTAIFYMQKVSYHSLAVAIASSANGNPIVLDYDDFDFNANSLPMLSKLLPGVSQIGMTAELLKHAELCVCSSFGLMDMVRPFNPKCEFIPTGTDLSVFDVALRDRAERPADDPVNMIWLGDLWDPQILKDVMMTVEAFAALPVTDPGSGAPDRRRVRRLLDRFPGGDQSPVRPPCQSCHARADGARRNSRSHGAERHRPSSAGG